MKPLFFTLRAGSLGLAGLTLALLGGCATGPNAIPGDPLEPLNRSVFAFNEGADRLVLRPVASAYQEVVPSPVRTGVTNFFGNISDVWSLFNNVLQLKPQESVETVMRISVNTVLGFAGVLDIATEARLQRHREDFGQTLGHWGIGTGPYLVLPLLGSSSVRDTAGFLVDTQLDLVSQASNIALRNSGSALRVVDGRSRLLGAGDVLDQAALDKYSFTRDIYMRRRGSLIGTSSAGAEERYDLPEAQPASAPSSRAPAAAPSTGAAGSEPAAGVVPATGN